MKRTILVVLVVAAALTAAACSDSSPTEPQGRQPASQVVINDPAGAFAAHHAAIRTLVENTVATVGADLPVSTVVIEVLADRARSIPGYGMGGYTLGPNRVELVIDPVFPNLEQILPARVPHVIAHELHHAVRWRGPGPYGTLLEALVFEGMADRYAIEALGTRPQPWSEAFPESQTNLYLDLARPEFDSFFDFGAWFFGTDPRYPRWTGYTLGFRLVADYQARTGQSAAQLVNTSADAFRPQ